MFLLKLLLSHISSIIISSINCNKMSIFKKVSNPTKSDEKKSRAAEGDVVAKLNLFEENYEQLYE